MRNLLMSIAAIGIPLMVLTALALGTLAYMSGLVNRIARRAIKEGK